jgi:hypothetical protein
MTLGPPTDADARLVRAAVLIAASHVADGGLCGGCRVVWSRLVPFPCPQRRWADAVLGEYGSADGSGSPAVFPS